MKKEPIASCSARRVSLSVSLSLFSLSLSLSVWLGTFGCWTLPKEGSVHKIVLFNQALFSANLKENFRINVWHTF